MFVPFEMCTVALALMIVEMVTIGVGLKIGFLDDLLDDFVDDLPDGLLVRSLLDLFFLGDLVKIFVDFPSCRWLFRFFIRSSRWVCPSMSSLICCAGRLKGLALYDTVGVATVLVSFCNLTVLILFSLFVKAWGEITVSMIVSPVV